MTVYLLWVCIELTGHTTLNENFYKPARGMNRMGKRLIRTIVDNTGHS